MEDLWGLDCATDHGGRTTLKLSSQTQSHHFNIDLNDHNTEYIPEEPKLDATQCETPIGVTSVIPTIRWYFFLGLKKKSQH